METPTHCRLKPWKIAVCVMLCYVLVLSLYVLVAGEVRYQKLTESDMLTASEIVGELTAGREVMQPFSADMDEIHTVILPVVTYDRINAGTLRVEIWEGETLLSAGAMDISMIEYSGEIEVPVDPSVAEAKGKEYTLRVAADSNSGEAITLYYGTGMSVGKGEISAGLSQEEQLCVAGTPLGGKLCFKVRGVEYNWLGRNFYYFAAIGAVLLVIYLIRQVRAANAGRVTYTRHLIATTQRYKFLIEQLVLRDFKTKYKRSVLGVLWSFLNPLLTMAVQYVVFSMLFQSNIPNFPVYLLCGIVCFNFFNETTNNTMLSIIDNASLISKVYVPKYLYPISRALSSVINLLLSLIPLFLIMLFTGTRFTLQILLLPYGLVCLVIFCIGMGLLLSTMMVFFRDTKFLWSVMIMLWMYLTPIFYPASIIPDRFMGLYKLNPLFHFIGYVRDILLYGTTPDMTRFLACFVAAVGVFVVGAHVFRRNQDRFILFI